MSVLYTRDKDGNLKPVPFVSGGATPKQLYTFLDAYTAWSNGESFPIAFYGDSTFQATEAYQASGRPRIFDFLQDMLEEECGFRPDIYNAGVRGTNLKYAIANFAEGRGFFVPNSQFGWHNAKMIGIGFGINDRLLYRSYQDYRNGVYADLETLINMCYDHGFQPFLLTSQATAECGVATNADENHNLANSTAINICANGAKKELAKKYGIPLIDLTKATEAYLANSKVPLNDIFCDNGSSTEADRDRLHFGETGFKYEAGYLFSQIVPRVIPIEGNEETIVSYTNQNLKSAVPHNKLRYGGDFKVYASYSKDNATDAKVFDAYVFVKDYPATLKAYKYDGGNTYAKVDGVVRPMSSLENDFGELDLGLHHLEVYTGGDRVVFNGFVLNENIRYDGSVSGSVLLDTTKVSGTDSAFANMSSEHVPAIIAPNFNAETKTTSLSGTTITAIYCAFRFTGNITIGKVDLKEFGTGSFTLIGAKSYAVDHDRFHVIEIDPIELGDHETLAIGQEDDSARLYFLTSLPDESARMYTASSFKAGGGTPQGMRIKVYGNRLI